MSKTLCSISVGCILLVVYAVSVCLFCYYYTTLLHPFKGLFSRTTCVSWYQKGKIILDLNEARDDWVWRRQWHQLDHIQIVCTALQTDNHTNMSSVNFYRPDAIPGPPNQQCQGTEGIVIKWQNVEV